MTLSDSGPMDRYAVMGNPIGHSKSPMIHCLFAEQTGQVLTYSAILVEPGQLPEAVEAFREQGGKGLNVTVPFKSDAFHLAAEHSPRAALARAVNTLILEPDAPLFGDNTDGVGLIRDLTVNHAQAIAGRRLLLLGAGGAARGVVGPLWEQAPACLVIANRTPERAVELAGELGDGEVRGCGFGDLEGERFDLVINATAASLSGELPPLPEGLPAPGACCYDLMYGAELSPFLLWGRAQGAGVLIDGLGMLVEQAAESFYLWRRVRPATGPIIQALRA